MHAGVGYRLQQLPMCCLGVCCTKALPLRSNQNLVCFVLPHEFCFL